MAGYDRVIHGAEFEGDLTISQALAEILKYPISDHHVLQIVHAFIKKPRRMKEPLGIQGEIALKKLLTSREIPKTAVISFYRNFPNICQLLVEFLNGEGVELKPKPIISDFFAGVGAGGDVGYDNRDFEANAWEI